MTRSVTALGLLLALAGSAGAQEQSPQPTNEERLEAKLKESFVANAPWVLDYEQALKQAKEENKVVFAYFSRSFAP